ncbi:meckelin [Microcaecilia unicolor]|uniref:Meckelin-like n=1 Tax=Microcaecilia unicolor TaxID=1415580 RepID=A0A6P7YC64_9AMPH|nr:meckelin-like [Microcaecilia unicolor]
MQPAPCILAAWAFLLLLLSLPPASSQAGKSSIAFSQPQNCAVNEFFNTVSLACDPCGPNQAKSPDGLRCVCSSTFSMRDVGNPVVECNACNITQVVSSDQRFCLQCLSRSCLCGSSQVREENFSAQTAFCANCSGLSLPNAIGNKCVPCQATFQQCKCPEANQTGGLCFPSAVTPQGNVQSAWESLFLSASFLACRDYNNLTACQLLTNIVIMNAFSLDSAAYTFYKSLPLSAKYRVEVLYSSNGADLGSTAPTGLSFQKNSQMQFKLARYDARGDFQGWQDVKGGGLQMCPDTMKRLDAAYVFGTSYSQSCTFLLSELLSRVPEPVFYELFLQYSDQGGKILLWPVPIENTNLQTTTQSTLGTTALRRFFLIDGLSGRTGSLSNEPVSVTVATSLTLSIYLPTSDPGNQPPFLLTVKYAKEDPKGSTQLSFAVSYAQSQETFKRDTDIALAVLGSLSVLYAIMETSSWVRRSRLQSIGITLVVKFLTFLSGALANVFFLIILGTGIYWLIAFKGQHSTVQVTLPPAGGQIENDFIIYLSCAFALKTLELLHIFVVQLSISIFLIDWEKPKARSTFNAAKGSPSVSIWRTFLVANEWNEIQTLRKLNPRFQLFAVLLLLEVVGLKNIAARDLNLDLQPAADSYLAPWSPILRFGISASMWLAVGAVQVIFMVVIYERFVEGKIQQFVDLCSVSNISVFILMHRCYGFYIHGRSVHGLADVNMETMIQHLRKEKENLCPLRGLEPNSEVQTFEILLSDRVRQQYDRIRAPLQEIPKRQKSRLEDDPLLDQRIKTYHTFNLFLAAFIEHVYKDMDYIVKDKLFLEQIMDMEFQQPVDKSIFYNDDGALFGRTLYYNNELVLLLFDILLFSIIDLGTQNFVLAGIITYIIQKGLEILRQVIGRKNLSAETMVEEQFLI